MVMFFRSGIFALWDRVLVAGEVCLNSAQLFRLAGMCVSLRLSAWIQPLNFDVLTHKTLH